MDHLVGHGDGQTPLDADEAAGLIPSWVATRGDLDRVEQENVATAYSRLRRTMEPEDILTEDFLRRLHREMFGDVWHWAGNYRTTAKNIGVDAWQIRDRLGQLIANVRYWIENSTFPLDEIAVRFHFELAAIHPFPNGNGRHARFAADLLAQALGRPRFTWGRLRDESPRDLRSAYIAALHAADRGEIDPLVKFART
jgi:Fic-DOC domain mobile mystery protein B